MLNCLKGPRFCRHRDSGAGCLDTAGQELGDLWQLGPLALIAGGEGRQCAPACLPPAGLSVVS